MGDRVAPENRIRNGFPLLKNAGYLAEDGMNWLTNLLKTIKEQSPYYNMAFSAILFFILFLPIFLSAETLKTIPEIVAFRGKYLAYIGIAFVIFFVFGIGQLIKKNIDHYKDKKVRKIRLRNKQNLLLELEKLYKNGDVRKDWKTQQDCIDWSNKVAPLLQFNNQYYSNFITYAHRINITGLSSLTIKPVINIMLSQVQMAIEELKNDLNTYSSRSSGN